MLLADNDSEDEPERDPAPSLAEFDLAVEKLTGLQDQMAVLIRVVANWGSGKTIKAPQPSPRPETALQRARLRRARQDLEGIEAMLFPG